MLSWTDERVDLLRSIIIKILSASRIAAELAGGVTRNAVIGKVHRLGLSGRVKTQTAVVNARPRPAEKPTKSDSARIGGAAMLQRAMSMPVRGNIALALQERPMPMVSRRASDDNVVSLTENVTIMELRESMCRWPVGDPSSAEFRYCGGKANIGEGPYCKHHSRMAYQPTQDRRQRKIA